MINDRFTTFGWTATDTPVAGGTSERIGMGIPIGSTRDIAQGQPVYVTICMISSCSGAGAGRFWVVSSDTQAFNPAIANRHVSLPSFKAAELNTHRIFSIALPSWRSVDFKEYLGVMFAADAGPLIELGRVAAFITLDPAPTFS